ncbi:hypothetical protein MSG28_000667 [Choristoneura fumiferana]|uniref:Uncharacterized protein n=1 Tax=Choristoneura fumiferana TaxID=7141 RepID=A0ACC0K1S2_CHOFU|nr:hypothetical protein MSG28_000667 [Choristoneura fumiferana]
MSPSPPPLPQPDQVIPSSLPPPPLLLQHPIPSSPTTTVLCPPSTSSSRMEDANVPSPAIFMECGTNSMAGSAQDTPTADRRPPMPRRPLYDDDIVAALNMGSESESDDSDEEGSPQPFIPRILGAILETPEDDVESTEDSPSLSPPLRSVSPATASSSSWNTPVEPRDFLDFKWRAFPTPSIPGALRRELFSDINVGPTVPNADPYETFVHIWDRQFMEHIASETNKYAQQLAAQLMLSNNLHPQSRICDWQDTTADELYVYMALIVAMGVVTKGRVSDYWNADETIFVTPRFRVYMSLRRFQLLSKCLHFRDNRDMYTLNLSHSEAKLYKIQPVVDHLNNAFQSSYNLQQNIALDESLLQWKGWLEINQFIPNKAAAVGIKTYEICESQTGYLWRFVVHAHKRTTTAASNTDPLQTFIPNIVLTLLQGLENKGHTVWMDNFYNSPALARRLKSLGFDCVGTLRTNRRFVPKELTDLTKAKMRPGQITGLTSGDVDLMVWRDQNRVAMISTYHGNATTQVKGVTKPVLIHDYNLMMGGVDKKDQMLASFPIERKRTKVWYKKLFRRLLNVSILNSYIISLLQGPRAVYTVREHYLKEYEFDPKLKGRKRRVCVVCRKRVTTYCGSCNKAACLSQCFVSIH